MRRVVAAAVVFALVEIASLSATLHTHQYAEHHHPEHQHGLAAHGHHDTHADAAAQGNHGGAAWAPCDPALHKTGVTFTSVEPTALHVVVADAEQPVVLSAEPRTGPRVIHMDVRVHGPPVGRETPPRAPPVIASRSIT